MLEKQSICTVYLDESESEACVRVFQSPPKGGESTAEGCKDTASASEPSSQETTPEKSECS